MIFRSPIANSGVIFWLIVTLDCSCPYARMLPYNGASTRAKCVAVLFPLVASGNVMALAFSMAPSVADVQSVDAVCTLAYAP